MKPHFFTTDSGEELVVLARGDYERLQEAASSQGDDADDARVAAEAAADLAAGRDVALPLAVAEAILDGEAPLRALRKWRGLTQHALARRSGLAQSAISTMEKGESEGSVKAWRDLAAALDVPVGLLVT